MDGLYTIEQLTRGIIDEFKLYVSDKDGGVPQRYTQRIRRALKECDIYSKGIPQINPDSRRKCMYYTEDQKQTILSQKSLYDYLRNNSTSDAIKNSPRYDQVLEAIKTRRDSEIDWLTSLNDKYADSHTHGGHDNGNIPNINNKEYRTAKNNMMIDALFHLFFTPINDDLLLHDLERVYLTSSELDLEVGDIEAEHRLNNPEGSYYQMKKSTKEFLSDYKGT